ncbi:LysR substrate-binding domain-containing protein [Salinibacterium sp.]|uniref:LysR family transcriptional regulator n=1 Tax=Salinibacterium sp. TaxID=1915057 RepID=UPI00286C093A|nr:LysR substrate-binding domain-containing protein [Salinibacterium sp.]
MATRALYLNQDAELDLRKLRYFLSVATTLNFGRAAEELHVAQPALSRAVKALEDDLGVMLFERNKHGVALTEAGRVLVGEADNLLAITLAARRRVRAGGAIVTTLSIGFRPGIIITPVVQEFTREYPDVVVVAHRIEWDEQTAALFDGRVDVAWVRTPLDIAGLTLIPLFDDAEMLALPIGHHLAGNASIVLDQLEDESLLRYDVAAHHATGTPSLVSGVRTIEEQLDAVASGLGLALLPETAANFYQRADITYRPVADSPPYQVALATVSGGRNRPEISAFVAAAQALYP